MNTVRRLILVLLGVMLMLTGSSAWAFVDEITFTGSGDGLEGAELKATATFKIDGNDLVITLTNIADKDENGGGKDTSGNSLTGLFFDFANDPTLTEVSATLPVDSKIIQPEQCDQTTSTSSCYTEVNVGGEFGFLYENGGIVVDTTDDNTSNPDTTLGAYGISSMGGDKFGAGTFNGSNLDDPDAVDGSNFAIISNLGTYNPNNGLATEPLIQDSVVFVLSGVSGLNVDSISNVSFQYGTGFHEPNIPGGGPGGGPGVPEPGTLGLIGAGMIGLVWRRRLLKKAA